MGRNKKKIIAILLFLFMSLIMFAAANPSGEIEGLLDAKPTINLDDNNKYSMEVFDEIPKFNASAKDAAGNDLKVDITYNIDNEIIGKYEVTFKTEDTNGNVTEVTEDFFVEDTTPPVITLIGRALIKRLHGKETYTDERARVTDNYDPTRIIGGTVSGDPFAVGYYYLLYNAQDSSGNRARQVTRTIKMLAPGADEDGDGYTNEEEYNEGTNYDDPNDHPDYDKAPTITLDENNIYSIEVYTDIPEFKATATDVADGVVPVTITHNIDANAVGTYTITFRAVDSLGNVKVITKDFKVIKRVLTVTIENKTSVFGSPLEPLSYLVSGSEVTPNAGITIVKDDGLNAGTYPIMGAYTNTNYDVTFVDGVYKITAKELSIDDLGSYTFTDKTFDYDKTEHTNEVTGLPEGFTVEYNNTNKRTEA
ncbi:MAG: DUF5011 domain-containing protein, partial [Mollicutes bacterium]|nr:DUF5011 domain-containing protein [Mollicutes bacterium]